VAQSDSLISGFGSVMDQEHALQTSIDNSLDQNNGPHATAISRILLQQQRWIGANIGLVARRFETLPHPARFHGFSEWPSPLGKNRRSEPIGTTQDVLPHLIAQHQRVLRSIDVLLAHLAGDQLGEQILQEIAHNHREMSWMLTALLRENETAQKGEWIPGSNRRMGETPASWENEGGSYTD
jgi:hypothetical protein